MDENKIKLCSRGGRKCSKPSGHTGGCDKKRKCVAFWEASPIQAKHKLLGEINQLESTKCNLGESHTEIQCAITHLEVEKMKLDDEVQSTFNSLEETKNKLDSEVNKLDEVKKQYQKLKCMLEQKQYARTKREQNPTTFDSIQNSSNSVRYQRREETKNILGYIHGGLSGALCGAWDLILGYADEATVEKFILSYNYILFIFSRNSSSISELIEDMEIFKLCL